MGECAPDLTIRAVAYFCRIRDYDANKKIDWHDYYLEALTPVQTVSVKLGNLLFTPMVRGDARPLLDTLVGEVLPRLRITSS